jgi:hypothetical protein
MRFRNLLHPRITGSAEGKALCRGAGCPRSIPLLKAGRRPARIMMSGSHIPDLDMAFTQIL